MGRGRALNRTVAEVRVGTRIHARQAAPTDPRRADAALDAAAEHALFERFARAAREGQETHESITILVSHRFSTVRMADLIVVLEGGRVVESGSHSDLMRSGGLYAELYDIQARAYR